MDNIAYINGEAAMAYQGATPWHRLGVPMEGLPNVAEAAKLARLDYNVVKEPIMLADGRVIPNRMATVAETTERPILGVVGPDYEVIQNTEAFGVLDMACEKFGVTIETAGALGDGEKTWMLAKMPESVEPMPGDKVDGYFLVINGFNGYILYQARLTPIRVVCQNTLNVAMQHGSSVFRMKHVAATRDQLRLVEKLIADLVYALKLTGDCFADLAKKTWDRQQIEAYIEKVIGFAPHDEVEDYFNQLFELEQKHETALSKKRDAILNLVWNGTGSKLSGAKKTKTDSGVYVGSTATAWSAYNAFTEYVDHARVRDAKNPERESKSALFGANAQLKMRALTTAMEMVAA